jgi:hypothetical protein
MHEQAGRCSDRAGAALHQSHPTALALRRQCPNTQEARSDAAPLKALNGSPEVPRPGAGPAGRRRRRARGGRGGEAVPVGGRVL